MTILEQILDEYLKCNNKICIDLAHYQIKRDYFEQKAKIIYQMQNLRATPKNWLGSQIFKEYEEDCKSLDLKRFCNERDFELRRGRVYLFAVKQKSLNLFD